MTYLRILPFLNRSTKETEATSITVIIKMDTNTPTITDVINKLLLSIDVELKVVVSAPNFKH